MPYFNNGTINILFLHIPKTGGTSIDVFLSKKYNIPLNTKSLFTNDSVKTKIGNVEIATSLQHVTYRDIIEHKEFFGIDFNDIKIITIVRNPYERIISDLFFLKLINKESSKDVTFSAIKSYISSKTTDGHNRPQYQYLNTDNYDLSISKITIMRTESLRQDMIRLGYVDFDVIANSNPDKIDHYSFLNNNSINLINKFYDKDFELFGYSKIVPVVSKQEKNDNVHFSSMFRIPVMRS